MAILVKGREEVMRSICFVLGALICGVSPAQSAEKPPLKFAITAPGPHSDLKDRQIYEISYDCSKRKGLPNNWSSFNRSMVGALVHINQAVIHQILVTAGVPSIDQSTQKIALPASSLSIFTLYGVAASAGVLGDFRKLCTPSIYVEGGQPINLLSTMAWSKQYSEGPLLSALYQFGNAISPLWSLFTSAAIPTAVINKVANVQATEAPLKSILNSLNKDLTFGKAITLQTGIYHVVTEYSDVKITVSPVKSLVRTDGGKLLQEFRKQVDGATERIDPKDIENTCNLLATELGNVGFSQDEDVPYGLAYIASRSLSTKGNMLKCLGSDYASSAAKLGPILWSYMPASKTVSVADAKSFFPPGEQQLQPPFASVDAKFNDFVRNLVRLGKGTQLFTDPALSLLTSDMAPTVLIVDHTTSFVFINNKGALDAKGLSQAMSGLNIHRYGCRSQMKDAYGDNAEGAIALFLVFVAPADATSTTLDKVILMRPIFKEGLVASLIASDDLDAIKAILIDHSWGCDGLAIAQPNVAASAGSKH